MHTDQDPISQSASAPGANHGANDAAVLVELAQSLTTSHPHNELGLAFIDAEDDGGIEGWQWIIGPTYTAEHLMITPEAMIAGESHIGSSS